jgi:hypothetical protein
LLVSLNVFNLEDFICFLNYYSALIDNYLPLVSLFDIKSTETIYLFSNLPAIVDKKNKNIAKVETKKNTRDLVVWGTNLGYTIGWPYYGPILRQMIVLPSYQLSVAIGIILSDAGLGAFKLLGSSAHLIFGQSYEKIAYF